MHREPNDDASRIVRIAIAGGLVPIRKGRDLYVLCCFHSDNNPSLKLNPQIDSYHCWSCHAKGGYVELAKRLGVNMDDVLGPKPTNGKNGHIHQAPRPTPGVPADILDLPHRTTDATVLAYIKARRWDLSYEQGRIRFTTPAAPMMRRVSQDGRELEEMGSAHRAGYLFGCLLRGETSDAITGIQLRRLSDDKPRFHTIGRGAFGMRHLLPDSDTVYLAEGLGDWVTMSQEFSSDTVRVLGFPGTHTVEGLLAPCQFKRDATVYCCFDHDEPGNTAAKLAENIIHNKGAFCWRER